MKKEDRAANFRVKGGTPPTDQPSTLQQRPQMVRVLYAVSIVSEFVHGLKSIVIMRVGQGKRDAAILSDARVYFSN